jgi:NAD(P)-dependent dehydrogenase (short-subunit alcohol dehydrogenase family)
MSSCPNTTCRRLNCCGDCTDSFGASWDIGAGVGQLSVALAADGWQVTGLDHNRQRFDALCAVIEAVAAADPEIGGRIQPVFGTFPEAITDADVAEDLAIAFGCTFTDTQAKYDSFAAALHRFKGALIDFAYLFVETKDERAWRARAAAYGAGAEIKPAYSYVVPAEDRRGEIYFCPRRADAGAGPP